MNRLLPTAHRILATLRLALPTAHRLLTALRLALPTAYCLLLTVTSCTAPQPATPPTPRDSIVLRDREVPVYVGYPEVQYEFIDTTQCPPNLPDTILVIQTKTVRLPGRTDTLMLPAQDSLIYISNFAAELQLKEQFTQSEAELDKWKQKALRRGSHLIIFGICAAVFLALLIGLFIKVMRIDMF